jgi:heat shock protein HslJ
MQHRTGRLAAFVLLLLAWAPAVGAADAGSASALQGLLGRRWAWESFVPRGIDAGTLVPPHPENYWLELLPEGKLSLQADCNRGFGSWTDGSSGLHFKPLGSTLMACGEASLGGRFLELLSTTSSVSRDGGALLLRSPSGVLRLREVRAQAAPQSP